LSIGITTGALLGAIDRTVGDIEGVVVVSGIVVDVEGDLVGSFDVEGDIEGSCDVEGTGLGSMVVTGESEGTWSPQKGPILGDLAGAIFVPSPQQSNFECWGVQQDLDP